MLVGAGLKKPFDSNALVGETHLPAFVNDARTQMCLPASYVCR